MDKVLELLDKLAPSTLSWVVIGIVALVFFVIGLLIIAFLQDREIEFLGIKIGSRPKKSKVETRIPPQIIDDASTHKVYLVEAGYRRYIPDRPTFEYLGAYLGFEWKDAKLIGDEIKDIPLGLPFPEIRLHCKKYELGLTIHRAMWGAKGVIKDVTREVSRLTSDEKLDLAVNIDMLGDPINETKWLVVAYSHNGELNIETVVKNGRLILP